MILGSIWESVKPLCMDYNKFLYLNRSRCLSNFLAVAIKDTNPRQDRFTGDGVI